MIIKYTVIDRGGGEFIPVVDVAGCEIYRGSIHHNAVTSEQADMKMLAIQERDEARARVAELEAALKTAWDAMCERRSYSDGWEWKYGNGWDKEDEIVSKALRGEGE